MDVSLKTLFSLKTTNLRHETATITRAETYVKYDEKETFLPERPKQHLFFFDSRDSRR